jgi:hypothetical protein
MFWGRNKSSYEIYVTDLDNNTQALQVKAETTVDEIL